MRINKTVAMGDVPIGKPFYLSSDDHPNRAAWKRTGETYGMNKIEIQSVLSPEIVRVVNRNKRVYYEFQQENKKAFDLEKRIQGL